MAVVSISLPEELLESADRAIEKRGFGGRSEFVRACLRDFLARSSPRDRPGRRAATLTLVYPEGRERVFSRLRHEHGDAIRTMVHGHAGDSCVELYLLEGTGERINAFADALRSTRDALQLTMAFTDAWKNAPDPSAGEPRLSGRRTG